MNRERVIVFGLFTLAGVATVAALHRGMHQESAQELLAQAPPPAKPAPVEKAEPVVEPEPGTGSTGDTGTTGGEEAETEGPPPEPHHATSSKKPKHGKHPRPEKDEAPTEDESGEDEGEEPEEEEAEAEPEEPEPEPEEPAGDDGEDGDDGGGGLSVSIANGPIFIKGSGTAWGQIKDGVNSTLRTVKSRYRGCLENQGAEAGKMPATTTIDLKFDSDSGRADRVQVFGDDFAAVPVAHKCLKNALRGAKWSIPAGASVRFRITFAYR